MELLWSHSERWLLLEIHQQDNTRHLQVLPTAAMLLYSLIMPKHTEKEKKMREGRGGVGWGLHRPCRNVKHLSILPEIETCPSVWVSAT